MDTPFGTTNQEVPSQGEPFVFSSFGNVGPPLMATLSLPILTIGLPIWLLSIPVISIPPCVLDVNSPSQEPQPPVNPPPSLSDVSSPLYSSLHVESCSTSNQVNKKKKNERKIKKKKNKRKIKKKKQNY